MSDSHQTLLSKQYLNQLVSEGASKAEDTKNPQKRGVDFGTYPGTKSLIIGLKFNY